MTRFSLAERRRVVKKGGKYYVYSEDYDKQLGGPFDTKKQALHRLGQIEYFKHREGKAAPMPENVEIRSFGLEIAELRVKNGDKGPIIHGYAARFGLLSEDLGGFREQIHEKAFERALQTSDVRALANHNADLVMGRMKSGTLKLATDERGLAYEIAPPDTPIMQHYVRSIERGDVDGSSFSFVLDAKGDDWDHGTDPPTRTLMSVRDIFDVGPVTYPAYKDSTAAKRSLDLSRPPDPRIYRQRLVALRLSFPSFAIPKG